jgi:hypothetical protein
MCQLSRSFGAASISCSRAKCHATSAREPTIVREATSFHTTRSRAIQRVSTGFMGIDQRQKYSYHGRTRIRLVGTIAPRR